jgi:predicted GTPase
VPRTLLSGLTWPIDPVVACTATLSTALLVRDEYLQRNRPMRRLVDLPGIGESLEADSRHLPACEHRTAQADRILYVIKADTRSFTEDPRILAQ